MTIVYSLVSRQKTVLAEFTSTSATGNFPTVTRVLLARIPATDGKMTYVYDQYVFHYVVEGGICYLCMSDDVNRHRLPYAFLQEIKTKFIERYGTEAPQTAIAFSMNDEFSRILQERMEFYNSSDAENQIDSLGAVKSQIEDVKDVMVQNIEKVLERGEKIELLVDKTDRLNQQAFKFESSSRNLRRAMYWKRVRTFAALAGIILLILLIVITMACGGPTYHRCRRH